MKGLRISYLLCVLLELARFVFIFLWSLQVFPWQADPRQNLPFLVLTVPGFLFAVQLSLLAYDPLTNAAMAKGLVPMKGLGLVPEFLLLVLMVFSRTGEANPLWLWAAGLTDLAIFWLLISLGWTRRSVPDSSEGAGPGREGP